jgi:RNA polymerase sigma-70 factor (ECF subfamily)
MELLERFAQGDLEAFETLFRQFQGEVFGWIIRIVRNPATAEDLTVETFWRVYRAHARFDPQGNFGGWIRRIATNAALDHLKTVRREVELPDDFSSGSPPDPAVSGEIRQRIAQAFRQLPARLRIAATLALVEEEPYERISEALGISVGAVKSRVFRVVRLLRKKLRQQGVEP